MKAGAKLGIVAAVAACALPVQSAQARSPLTCTWAGTHVAPTGTFWVSPGVTYIPSAGPLAFRAIGRLAGGRGCHGTMTFEGQMDAGATCPVSTFRGKVIGLPGVARFEGRGSYFVPSVLYDSKGHVVGVENADIVTQSNFPHTNDCSTPQGFRGGWPGMFSSVVQRFG